MFGGLGGHGVFAQGLCFAMESHGEVFVKVDAESEPRFSAAGSLPFIYLARGKPMTTSLLAPSRERPRRGGGTAPLGLVRARGGAAPG
jgi:TfoX/Sxy family transcriptional regulator of competence genes